MVGRSAPAPFLMKTYELVDDRSTDDVVSWNESGTAFVVWKTVDFARDLLPAYFKHNNFSSFIRQLNTYGFRKIVQDKWEFSNEKFMRGQKHILNQIRRRKTVHPSPIPAAAAEKVTSPSNSGDDLGSTSTSSSPNSKNPGSVETSTISKFTEENEKLKRENKLLSTQLGHAKQQCDELIGYLTKCVKVGPDEINKIVKHGLDLEGSIHRMVGEKKRKSGENVGCVCDDDDENGGCLKLFGVWMKEKNKKRGHEKIMDFCGGTLQGIK